MNDQNNNRISVRAARSNTRLVASLLGLVLFMGGMSYAAVPLYRVFCQVTGFGGTTQRSDAAPGPVLDRMVQVRFDANTANGLAWRFKPVLHTVDTPIGQQTLAFYQATNLSDQPVTGVASFNVTPEIVGSYFHKIECFCFTEQTLQPGQSVDMPVSFFVDPAIEDDKDARRVQMITLSYTFFPVETGNESGDREGKEAAAAEGRTGATRPNG